MRIEYDDIELDISADSVRADARVGNGGHAAWFSSVFEHYSLAMSIHEFVGCGAHDALRCIELITAAYASDAADCREMPVGDV